MRLVALGDRDPAHLTHREIDATLALLADQVHCGWVATDSPQARQLDEAASDAGEGFDQTFSAG